MRGVLLALWILASSVVSVVSAQEPDIHPSPSEAVVHVDEDTGERYVEERPSEPIRQGAIIAPPWAIYAAGVCVVAVSVLLLARRLRASA